MNWMKLMPSLPKLFPRWETGRQEVQDSYEKLAIMPTWLSKLLTVDMFLLYVAPDTYIPEHLDEAPEGFVHWRLNVRPWGKGRLYLWECDQGAHIRDGVVTLFRASEEIHSFYTRRGCLILSMGWLKKETTNG